MRANRNCARRRRWLSSADAADLGFDAALSELVAASQQAIDAANKAREEAREQELRQAEAFAEEQRQRIAEQNRAAKRMRYSMMGLAAVFVVAVGAAIFAWMQSEKAQQLAEQEVSAREEAEARRIESEQARAQAERLRAASIAQLLLTLAPQQQAIDQDERSALMARQAYLLSGNDSGRLRDHADRVLRTVLTAPGFAATLTTEVLAVDFSPDGRMLAASSYAGEKVGQMLLWDLSRRSAPPITLPGPTDENFYTVSFRPDGKVLAAARDEDGTVLLWDLEQPGDPPTVVAGYEGGAWSLAFSPDGRHLAIGARYDDTVRLLDLSDPDAGLIFGAAETGLPDIAMRLAVNPGGVAVAFSPDGRTLAAGSHLGSVRIWDPSAPTKPVFEYRGHEGPVWSLAFSPDGNRLASGGKDATVRVWDMRDADAPPRLLRGHEEGITSLAFGRDGETLASGSTDDSIRLWDLANPDDGPVLARSGPLDVHDLAISPDGLRLASGASGLHGLQLWDLRPSGQPGVLPQDGSLVSVAISPDGAFLASTSDDVIRLRNQSDPSAPPTDLRGHSKKVWGLAFSPDGNMLSSTSQDGTVRLWRLGSPIEEIAALKGTEPWSAPFSPDGKTLATSYYDETTEEMILRLWDLNDLDAEPMVLRTEMTRWINEIAFSSDGRRLVATGREGLIHLEDLESPGAGAMVLRGHEGMIMSVAFSPDSTQLASGGRDSTVRLWDLADEGTPSSILGQHDDEVVRVRFSPDGKYLATSSKDRSVRLWNLVTPNTPPALLHGHEGAVWALAWSPDSKTLVSGSKQLLFWDLTHPVTAAPLGRLAELVCEKVWRNLTLEEWHQFVGTDIPYERTCPNLPIHPSLLETAEKNAKAGDKEGAVALFQRAIELQPDLRIRPEAEAARLAGEAQ